MFMLKIWHYLNYKDHFYKEFVRPAENECVFGCLRTIFGSFRFLRVGKCYNCASSDAVASLLSAGMF